MRIKGVLKTEFNIANSKLLGKKRLRMILILILHFFPVYCIVSIPSL